MEQGPLGGRKDLKLKYTSSGKKIATGNANDELLEVIEEI